MSLLTLASTAAQDIILYSHSFKVMTFILYLISLNNMQVQGLHMSADHCEQLLYHKYFTLSFYMLSKSKHYSNEKPLLLSSHLFLASQREKKIHFSFFPNLISCLKILLQIYNYNFSYINKLIVLP